MTVKHSRTAFPPADKKYGLFLSFPFHLINNAMQIPKIIPIKNVINANIPQAGIIIFANNKQNNFIISPISFYLSASTIC